jgi:hypothetical protein
MRELGLVLPAPPMPLGAYIEASATGRLLFLSGMLPVVDRKLALSGRLGENLSVKEGQETARIASLNALTVAKQHLSDLNRLKKLSIKSFCANLWVGIRPRSTGVWSAKPASRRASDSGHAL